jgi:hypothetical protein
MNAQNVIEAFASYNEAGEVTSFNFADFDELVSALVTERAKIRKDNKETIKAQKEAANAVLAEAGKKYYDSLKEGDVFTYKTADGTAVTARKILTKSGSGNSAACEVISGIETGKSNKRYPKFYQVVIAE